jgi:hypothetical protein
MNLHLFGLALNMFLKESAKKENIQGRQHSPNPTQQTSQPPTILFYL